LHEQNPRIRVGRHHAGQQDHAKKRKNMTKAAFRISLSAVCKLTAAALMLSGISFAATLTSGIFAAEPAQAVPRRVRNACRNDYKSLCPRYKIGTSQMRNCMRANGSQLSWGCYEALRDHGYVNRGGSSRRSSRGRSGSRY
jgi:hypothetical protein